MPYDLNSTRTCIKVYDTAELADSARLALLNNGVRFAWSDDTRNEIADGFGVWVQECDARGAYVRLKALQQT
jgi:hypothetical protein